MKESTLVVLPTGLGKTVVRLKPDSSAALESLQSDRIRMNLISGALLVRVKDLPKESLFEVAVVR